MTKDEFLNLVYVAYNSAIKAKHESIQKMEYFAQLNIVNEESEKAKRVYDIAVYNINRLKSIIKLPLYEKINMLSNQELENYKLELIRDQQEFFNSVKKNLDDLLIEKERLVLEQEENYTAFSSEQDSEKRDMLVEKGKNVQSKIVDVDNDIEKENVLLNEIRVKISELHSKSLSDIREELIEKLDLSNLKYREDIKYVPKDDVMNVAKNSGDVEGLLQLLQEYRTEKSRDISYSLTLPSQEVVQQLDYLNKDKQMINGVTLTVESFSDIYNFEKALDSRVDHLNWYIKKIINEYNPFFNNVEFVLEKLDGIKNLDIQNFKERIEFVIEKFPSLSNRISYNLSSLNELDTFIGRNFKGKQIEEYKTVIIENIYEFILNLLEEELRKLSNCIKGISYEKNINEDKTFNSEYLIEYSKKLTKDNCMEVVLQVNATITAIYEVYQHLTNDLNTIKKDSIESISNLRNKLNVRQNKLDEINRKINVIVGSRLQSSDLERLLNTYSAEALEENLAQVEFLKLINTVRNNAYLQKIDINDLYEFSDNFVFPEEEDLEETKKV